MAYAVLADFKTEMGSRVNPPGPYEDLTDRTGGSVANDAVGQQILNHAHTRLDSYLAKRFQVPIDTSSDAGLLDFLKGEVLHIAVYLAYATYPTRPEPPKGIAKLYADTIAFLVLVQKGEALPPSSSPIAPSTSDGVTGQSFGHAQQFTEDGMKGL